MYNYIQINPGVCDGALVENEGTIAYHSKTRKSRGLHSNTGMF